MAMRYKFLIIAAVLILCGCSNNSDKKTINIAVTGSPGVYSEYYEQGIKKAYNDVCEEYKDSGFEINCEFYDDKDDYETAEKITAGLVNDSSITAVIGSSSAEICKNQAYLTDRNDKILVCPHRIYDSMLENENYGKVFSLNYSSKDIGNVMLYIAKESTAEKWAVCYSDDEISREEIKEFNNSNGNDLNVVDFVKINSLMADFDNVTDRWELLGVEGIVLIPYDDEGFDLLYKLKDKMPYLYVISDASLDDDNELQSNEKYFENVYLVDDFYISEEESETFDDEEYLDTWEIHGYNAFRMIVDTAIKNNTDDPEKISEILHREGYSGALESYRFNEKGALEAEEFTYIEITGEGTDLYSILASN